MITVRNLVKTFGDTPVLCGLNLDVKRGDIIGLAGRSGAGKSTLLRCINGLELFDSGSMIVDGIDISTLSRKDMMAFRKNTGMIFQHFSLLERLNVYDNVALPLRCWKYKSGTIDKKVKELLEIVGIPEKIRQKPRELSGGQKQRVAIARALTMDPRILLCDEATSALDPKTSKAIVDLLLQINGQLGITIVVVTHQMPVLRDLCQKIAILENGKVAVSGRIEEIFRDQPGALKNLTGEDTDGHVQNARKTIALLLPEIFAGPMIPQMATHLGIDITVQGGWPGLTGNNSNRLVISFSEDVYPDIERYCASHGIAWTDIENIDYDLSGTLKPDRQAELFDESVAKREIQNVFD